MSETLDPRQRAAIVAGVASGRAPTPRYAAIGAAPPAPTAAPSPGAPPGRRSQATEIVDLALKADIELWHGPDGEPYMTIPRDGHREHHRIRSRAAREWLAGAYYAAHRRAPRAQAIGEATEVLAAQARYSGAQHDVHVRVAGADGRIYLDLGDEAWRAVEIGPEGWRVVTDPPVRFRRPRGLRALPQPAPGGSLEALRALVNVAGDRDWALVVGWLIGALRPQGPYPVLCLSGEQGSAKSTAARLLRGLIDPHQADLRAEAREVRDLMIAAASGWVVALDNLSRLSDWASDALCRLSTGGALGARTLYTDDEETILAAQRPVIIASITDVVTRGDLLDRCLAVTLPVIAETRRRPESDVMAAYEAIRPQILGALCDAVSGALRDERETRLARLPRMADWARWVTAAEPALGWAPGTLLRAHAGAQLASVEAALEGDRLATAILGVRRPWSGTAAELLEMLTRGLGHDATRPPADWPRSARGLAGALRRLAPLLRGVGVEVTWAREPRTGRRVVTVASAEQTGAQPSPPSPPSPVPQRRAGSGDGPGDDGDRPSPASSPPSGRESGAGDGGDDGDGLLHDCSAFQVVPEPPTPAPVRACAACGGPAPARQRYCRPSCRERAEGVTPQPSGLPFGGVFGEGEL